MIVSVNLPLDLAVKLETIARTRNEAAHQTAAFLCSRGLRDLAANKEKAAFLLSRV